MISAEKIREKLWGKRNQKRRITVAHEQLATDEGQSIGHGIPVLIHTAMNPPLQWPFECLDKTSSWIGSTTSTFMQPIFFPCGDLKGEFVSICPAILFSRKHRRFPTVSLELSCVLSYNGRFPGYALSLKFKQKIKWKTERESGLEWKVTKK